jgi:hypothetical protein
MRTTRDIVAGIVRRMLAAEPRGDVLLVEDILAAAERRYGYGVVWVTLDEFDWHPQGSGDPEEETRRMLRDRAEAMVRAPPPRGMVERIVAAKAGRG